MSENSIPKNTQVESLLSGNILTLLSEHFPEPIVQIRSFLSITRSDVHSYLEKNPNDAVKYFEKHSKRIPDSGLVIIQKDGEKYCVFEMYRGEKQDLKQFNDLISAVTEHVLVDYGMY